VYSFVFLFDLIDLDSELLRLFFSQDLLSLIIEVILSSISVISIAIIFYKFRQFRKVESDSKRFMSFFARYDDLFELKKMAKKFRHSPLSTIFLGGCERLNINHATEPEASFNGIEDSERGFKITALEKYLGSVIEDEISNTERYLFFLATTANISPLMGLFGTVWGVMNVFIGIGGEGSVNIAVVGPGIAEALITTIFGLIAAIPAAIAFNYYNNRIDRMTVQMNSFANEFLRFIDDKFAREGRKVRL
jgi:biopolymer transport protein TolQ